jgi:hypothetical protein
LVPGPRLKATSRRSGASAGGTPRTACTGVSGCEQAQGRCKTGGRTPPCQRRPTTPPLPRARAWRAVALNTLAARERRGDGGKGTVGLPVPSPPCPSHPLTRRGHLIDRSPMVVLRLPCRPLHLCLAAHAGVFDSRARAPGSRAPFAAPLPAGGHLCLALRLRAGRCVFVRPCSRAPQQPRPFAAPYPRRERGATCSRWGSLLPASHLGLGRTLGPRRVLRGGSPHSQRRRQRRRRCGAALAFRPRPGSWCTPPLPLRTSCAAAALGLVAAASMASRRWIRVRGC